VGLGQHPREPGSDRVVERDHQRGDAVVGLEVQAGRECALDPVHDPLLDVGAHERVQPELGAEVVVQRPGRRLRRGGQRPDVDVLVTGLPEGVQRRQHEPSLRTGGRGNPFRHN
jgi:hypothetical protein